MELSKAKETLKNIKRCCFEDEQYQKYGFMEQYMDISDVEAIDTVLKALDNSISKDEIRKKIEKLEFLRDDAIEDNFLGDARNLKERIDVLQKLLGEE